MNTFFKSFAAAALGLCALACAAPAEASGLTSSQISAIVSVASAFGADSTTVQSIRSVLELSAEPMGGAQISAAPSRGSLPLDAALGASGLTPGSSYIFIFGDGTRSSPFLAVGGEIAAGHTYKIAGTYTAAIEPYVACMWSMPACALAIHPLASTTVEVLR